MEKTNKEFIFKKRDVKLESVTVDSEVHIYGNSNVCLTDNLGYSTPKNKDIFDLVLHASEGFIPLWSKNASLRWRFNPSVYNYFQNPEMALNDIRSLLSNAIIAWKDAAPVLFTEQDDAWDFEIVIRPDYCNSKGCVMASSFLPDSGRHQFVIYPKLFSQSAKEQLDTFIHELGHIFGLRHFFAKIYEAGIPSVVFGKENPKSIMNYGANSELTDLDIADLKMLYQMVWDGKLREINGTKIVTFNSYHQVGAI